MRTSVFTYIYFCLAIWPWYSCTSPARAQQPEFRGVWVATVENIDWPSQRNLTAEQQKQEFINLLDVFEKNHLNAVLVQVRPCADAFYKSPYEPFSYYLTGQQGKDPGYDPLAFMIEECHNRHMQLHAWFNPYRAVQNVLYNKLSEEHITKKHPEWFVTYGTQKIFNPGEPAVWKYVVEVVSDVVKRYDIDGVHLDDYFYPYRIPGKAFGDQKEYKKYGNGMPLDNWRRQNVDTVVHLLHDAIKSIKPDIPFGISPFGVWRNKSIDPDGSDTRAGQTNYDDLYADILKWLRNDWIDYVAPQLYWEHSNRLCDYKILVQWWSDHSYGKPVYVGHAIYRIGEKIPCWGNAGEVCKQIRLSRGTPNVGGSIFYNASSFRRNPGGLQDSLQNDLYHTGVSVPMPLVPQGETEDHMMKLIRQQMEKEE